MTPQSCMVCMEGADGGKFEAKGMLLEGSGLFSVSFRFEGDGIKVEQVPGGLHYARRGAQYVDVAYLEGRTTVCRIGDGRHTGEFPVCTGKVTVSRKEERIDVCVTYRLAADAAGDACRDTDEDAGAKAGGDAGAHAGAKAGGGAGDDAGAKAGGNMSVRLSICKGGL